ncbi:hypothetical protein PoB_007288600 [Plakobranchus ocellatus]|uniref:Secreted protein n=1 Tax=Plakobranchus ocellatus TaxID=259542 RepID=A0AAV4DR92_9GAST|nr:hypothetical protein PoB_007288600 [Plakobranchus ocellatus]
MTLLAWTYHRIRLVLLKAFGLLARSLPLTHSLTDIPGEVKGSNEVRLSTKSSPVDHQAVLAMQCSQVSMFSSAWRFAVAVVTLVLATGQPSVHPISSLYCSVHGCLQ